MKAICVILLLCITIKRSSAVCENLPPGIDRVIRGIDVTELDFIPAELTQSNGFNHPVIEFTCTTGRKWHNPSDPSVIYDVPDQVEAINSLPGGVADFKSHLYVSHTEVKETMTTRSSTSFFFGLFSSSSSYKKMQLTIIDKLHSVVEMYAYISAYEVQLKPYLQQKMGTTVQELLDQLPATYQQNPDKYQEFISIFGTHFLNSGRFGGYLSTKFEVSENLVQKLKEKEIKAEAGASFLGLIKIHGGYNGATGKVSVDFQKDTHIHESYYGGNANLLATSGPNFAQWSSSVTKNPWLFGGQLVPLTNLIPVGPKRDALAFATVVKLDKAYLEDLSRSLGYLSGLLYIKSNVNERTMTTNYQNQVNALKNQAIPNHNQVLSLGKVIDSFITTERNKAALKCLNDKKYCNSDSVDFYYPTADFYESYSNKTTIHLNPKSLDSL